MDNYTLAKALIPLGLILILLILILKIYKKCGINNVKEYIKDDTIKKYHLIFNLINNNDISFLTTTKEFNKIKEWYESSTEPSYLITSTCSTPTTIISGKYVNLNKENIVNFSYSGITNKDKIINPIKYLLTYPVPKIINVYNYFRSIILFSIILVLYKIYEKNILSLDIKSIFSNKLMLDSILNTSIKFITILFVLYYVGFFIFKLLEMIGKDKDYIYEFKNQKRSKIYNYASSNFIIISCLSFSLLSINIL